MRSVCSFAANRAVHPHGRGDNILNAATAIFNPGSPPRAWGQCDEALSVVLARRFTPTGVGTMLPGAIYGHLAPVHLHGRGDNIGMVAPCARLTGSPPRAWGQLIVTGYIV